MKLNFFFILIVMFLFLCVICNGESSHGKPYLYNMPAIDAMNAGDYTKGLELSNLDIIYDPNNPHNWQTVSDCYWGLKEYDKMIEALNNAIELDSNYAESYNELSLAYFMAGMEDKGIKAYQKCNEVDSDYCKYKNPDEIIKAQKEMAGLLIKMKPSSSVLQSFRQYPNYNLDQTNSIKDRTTEVPTTQITALPTPKYTQQVSDSSSGSCPVGKCWVNSYTRKDGTKVQGYCRKC